MKAGVLGTGMVGQALSLGLLRLGYEVKIGTRHPDKISEFIKESGNKISVGSFADAAKFGDIIVLAVKGVETEHVIKSIDKKYFENKIVIDVTNPLLFENENSPPKPAKSYPDSQGASVQKLLPKSKVVKAFNMTPSNYMTNPNPKEGDPDLFIAGNDKDAKMEVEAIAKRWGWKSVIDIGDIEQSYILETLTILWTRYGFLNNNWTHAFKLLKK